jgi:hypothetical protein
MALIELIQVREDLERHPQSFRIDTGLPIGGHR